MIKNKLYLLSTVVAVLLLSACASPFKQPIQPEVIVVKEQKVVVVTPPEELVKTCFVPEPPNRTTYLKSEPQKKEESLSFYIKDLLKSISVCNNTIISIQNYIRDKSLIENSTGK